MMALTRHRTPADGTVGSPSAETPALSVIGVAKRFGRNEVVRDLTLEVQPGELMALLGPSGCGKTTSLRLIAGFEEPDSGTIRIGGRLVAEVGPRVRRIEPPERRRVGMVFQDYALFPHLNVARNVSFGLPRGERNRGDRVAAALTAVGLAEMTDRMPDQLSGGQQQRVALARALAPNPDLVLLDEPFSNLDAELRVAVREEVREILRNAGATAVLVTHDQEEALSLADRVAVMFGGELAQTGSPEELYHRPATRDVAAFVGDAQFLPAEASGRRATCELGELPISGQASGPVDIMLRPEQLRLIPATEAAATNATVLSRLFFGHDQLLTVQLDSGGIVKARVGAYGGIRPGDRVQTAIRGAALAFPRNF
jgi:iron(III) transport system ATP-binding protein